MTRHQLVVRYTPDAELWGCTCGALRTWLAPFLRDRNGRIIGTTRQRTARLELVRTYLKHTTSNPGRTP